MNEKQFDDYPNLLDDDPALDYTLFKEMEKEGKDEKRRQQNQQSGCLSLVLLLPVPPAGIYLFINLIN